MLDRPSIVDISHEIEPFHVAQAAFVVQHSYTHFPDGSVHVLCIDDTISPENKPIIAKLNKHYFVCADNGICTLYWLSHDLRLDDNAALLSAARSQQLLIVYCIEPRLFSQYRYHTASLGTHRWQLIKQSLVALDKALRELGQGINYVVGEPEHCLTDLVQRHSIDRLVCSYRVGSGERRATERLAAACPRLQIEIQDTYTLFTREDRQYCY